MTMSFSIGAGRTILRATATDSTDGADFSFADALATDTSYLIQASLSIGHFSQTTEPPTTIPTAGAGHAPAQGMAFDGVTLGYADYVQPTGISTPSLSQGTMLNNYIIDGAPFDGDPANANGRFDVVIRYSCGAAYAPYLTQQFDFSYHQENSRKKIDLTHLMVHFGGRSAAVNRSEFFLRKLCAGHGGINSCAPFLENFAMPSSTSPMETIRATGSVADDRIFGLGGNEILAGADLLDGGTGTETATYAASRVGVNASSMTGAAGGRHEGCWILRL